MAANEMTKGDRDNLLKVIGKREKVAKAAAAQRSAELLADVEKQLASDYKIGDDAVWTEVMNEANRAIKEANRQIAERCRELGIAAQFAPSVEIRWYKRGEQASADRVAELRRVAKTRIDAMEKAACVVIETGSVELQTRIFAGALESGEAAEFLASMPSIGQLMPAPPTVAELEVGAPSKRREW